MIRSRARSLEGPMFVHFLPEAPSDPGEKNNFVNATSQAYVRKGNEQNSLKTVGIGRIQSTFEPLAISCAVNTTCCRDVSVC